MFVGVYVRVPDSDGHIYLPVSTRVSYEQVLCSVRLLKALLSRLSVNLPHRALGNVGELLSAHRSSPGLLGDWHL